MELSSEELEQRVAVVRRFKSLLEQQKAKLIEYLDVLELQQKEIEAEDADAIMAHTRLEEQIVSNIGTLQKVIAPIEEMYASFSSAGLKAADLRSVAEVQADLSDLHCRIQQQSRHNRDLLRNHMEVLKQQLTDMRNPFRNGRSVYADAAQDIGNIIHVNA